MATATSTHIDESTLTKGQLLFGAGVRRRFAL